VKESTSAFSHVSESVLTGTPSFTYADVDVNTPYGGEKSKNIGVTMFSLKFYGDFRTLDAIAMAAAEAGYSITLVPVERPTLESAGRPVPAVLRGDWSTTACCGRFRTGPSRPGGRQRRRFRQHARVGLVLGRL
jgi:hypothetical protein